MNEEMGTRKFQLEVINCKNSLKKSIQFVYRAKEEVKYVKIVLQSTESALGHKWHKRHSKKKNKWITREILNLNKWKKKIQKFRYRKI